MGLRKENPGCLSLDLGPHLNICLRGIQNFPQRRWPSSLAQPFWGPGHPSDGREAGTNRRARQGPFWAQWHWLGTSCGVLPAHSHAALDPQARRNHLHRPSATVSTWQGVVQEGPITSQEASGVGGSGKGAGGWGNPSPFLVVGQPRSQSQRQDCGPAIQSQI